MEISLKEARMPSKGLSVTKSIVQRIQSNKGSFQGSLHSARQEFTAPQDVRVVALGK